MSRRPQTPTISLIRTRDDLLSELTKLRVGAERRDARALAKHQRDEAEFMRRFRKACLDASKWDYETAKANSFEACVRRERGWKAEGPSCPISEVSQIDALIALLGETNQERFTLTPNGPWSNLYAVLTAGLPQTKGLC